MPSGCHQTWLADPQSINDFPSCKHPSRAGIFQRSTFDHQMVFPEMRIYQWGENKKHIQQILSPCCLIVEVPKCMAWFISPCHPLAIPITAWFAKTLNSLGTEINGSGTHLAMLTTPKVAVFFVQSHLGLATHRMPRSIHCLIIALNIAINIINGQ